MECEAILGHWGLDCVGEVMTLSFWRDGQPASKTIPVKGEVSTSEVPEEGGVSVTSCPAYSADRARAFKEIPQSVLEAPGAQGMSSSGIQNREATKSA